MAENRVFLRAHAHAAPFARRRLVLVLAVAFMAIPLLPSTFGFVRAAGNLTRTFGNTGTGRSGGVTINSTGTLGNAPTVTSGYYNWTVPATGRYQILVEGAAGAAYSSYAGGRGASVTVEWNLTSGQVLKVFVGQEGTAASYGSGGGGASGVFAVSGSPATILAMAGGGGGGSYAGAGNPGLTGSSGANSGGVTGGSNGAGGDYGNYPGDCGWGSGGGGYSGDGAGPGGRSYTNGGVGSATVGCYAVGYGGFGAAGGGAGSFGGGGGGGYSGGAGGQYRYGGVQAGGGGGGSYYAGALASSAQSGSRSGHGNVVFTLLAPAPTTFATSTASPSNLSSLSYDIVFSESVSGLATSDFTVTGTSSGWSVTSLTGSGTTYVLTVASGAPTSGTVIVTMLQNAVLGATTGQLGPGGDTAAATMTIDVDAPTASSGTTPSSPAAAMSLTFGVNFSESVTGIAAGDFSNIGTALGCVFTPSAASGTSVNVVVTQCQEGTLQLQLAANGVTDTAGNTGPVSALTSSSVTLAASALSVTAGNKSINYGGSWVDSYTPSGLLGSDSITVTYSYSGTTTLGSSYGPSATKPTAGGTYSIIPGVSYGAGNANRYALTKNNGSLTISRVAQSVLTLTSTTATYGQNLSLASSGGSGTGAVTYAVTSGTCSVTGSTLTPGDAGSLCTVTATKAADDNYTAVSSAATTVTVNRTAQATLTVTSTSATYGQDLALTATGGSGGGAVTWAVVSGTCTVSGSTLTPGNAGSSCVVRATKALDTNYNAVNSADTAVTINRAAQAALTVSSTTATYGSTLSLTSSGGSGTGAVTWQIMLGTCTVTGSTLTPGDAGSSCTVRATKAQDTNYLVENSSNTSITINRANQATLTVTSTSATYGQNYALTTSGGSGGGAVSWTVVSGTCTVSGSTLTPGNAASACVVRATKALDTNYNAVNSSNTSVTVNKAPQSGLSVTSAAQFVTGSPLSLTASGGQSSGSLTWSVTAGTCALAGTSLTASRGGITCTVEVTRAGDSNYLPSSDSMVITVNKVAQTLTFRSSAPSPANPGGTYTVSVDSDAFLAPVIAIANSSSSVCSIAAGVVTFNAVGSCVISASQAGNDTYSAASASQSVNVVAVAAAAPVVTTPAVSVPVVPSSVVTASSVVPTTTIPLVKSAVAVTTTTVPRATTTTTSTTTTTTVPADPGKPNAGPDGAVAELKAGQTYAVVRGQKVKARVSQLKGTLVITLPNDVTVTIGASGSDPDSAKVAADGILRVFKDQTVEVNAEGLVGGTTYTVFMFSDPVELGRGSATASGTVKTLVRVPKDAKAEQHTLQVNGVGTGGEVVSVSMGFKVIERQNNTRIAVLAIALGMLLALLGGRPVFRRRRGIR